MSELKPKKKYGPIEILLVVVIIGVVWSVVATKTGCHILKKTEQEQWIDRKGNEVN